MLIRHFTVEEILKIEEKYTPIIDNILYVGDTLLFKARSKTGKSVIAQQIGHSVSSGESLFGIFKCHFTMPVCYVSGEGYIGNWKERFQNMEKMCGIDRDNFVYVECTSCQLHTLAGGQNLLKYIMTMDKPFGLFIFDPIMFLTVGGSYNNDTDMNTFFNNIEMVKRHFNATAIVVHHDSEKDIITKDGGKVKAANEHVSMGASSINAVITHSYTLEKHGSKDGLVHKMKLSNNRSNRYVEELDLKMITPETDEAGRLGYELHYRPGSKRMDIMMYMQKNGGVISDSKMNSGELDMSKSTLYHNLGKMLEAKIIEKRIENGHGVYILLAKGLVAEE